jgi:DNA primase
MSQRPYVSFAEVKEKVSILDVLDALGIADHFQRKNDTLTGVCPLPAHKHGPCPNTEQFKISVKKNLWKCFGDCDKGGDIISLVKEYMGYDDAHVRFYFSEHFGDRLRLSKPNGVRNNESATNSTKDDTETVKQPTQDGSLRQEASQSQSKPIKPLRFRLNLNTNVPYLHERGLTDETIMRYGLGLCNRGVLKSYIAIPVYGHPHEPGTNPLAYLGRWPGDDFDETAGHPRYKWPEGFPKSQIVYGLAEALENCDGKPLIVVEGPFKVYHLFQAGFPNTVATFGSSLSDEQSMILVATGRPIILMYDGDEAGRTGMRMAAGKLITKTFVRVVKLPDGTEPDDLSAEHLRTILP